MGPHWTVYLPNIETSSANGRIVLTKGRVSGIRYSKELSLVKKLKKLKGTLESKTKLFEEKYNICQKEK